MRRIVALVIAVAMTAAACGGSDETTPETAPETTPETAAQPDVKVEVVDDDAALGLAGGDVQVIDGCRIEPNIKCPRANLFEEELPGVDLQGADLSSADLSGADLSGARLPLGNLGAALLCSTTMPDGTVRNDGC